MTPKLTNEMRAAQQADPHRPVLVEDDQTQVQYVLLPLEIYQRVRSLFEDDFEISDTYAAQDQALAEVWDDPELDAFASH